MTTPAINNHMISQGRGQRWTLDRRTNSITGSIEAGYPVWKRFDEVRPESSSHPKDSSGWRDPGPWNHSVSHVFPCPRTAFWVSNQPPGVEPIAYIYAEGYGWDQTVFGLPSFPSWMEDAAVARALSALKNQNVNYAVAFAEAKQTTDFAVSVIQRTGKLIRGLRNVTKPSTWRRVIKQGLTPEQGGRQFLNDFLEFQYAARPLKADLFGVCKDFDEKSRQDKSPFHACVRGNVKEIRVKPWFKPTGATGYIGYMCESRVDLRCKVRLDYELQNPMIAALASTGLLNPLEVVWEKLPFSFVADWFLPIGPWLSQLDATAGWSFRSGTCSKVTKVNVFSPLCTCIGYWKFFEILNNSPYSERRFDFRRTVYNRSPHVWIPRFKNPLSGTHVANAIALLMQRVH